MKRTRRNRRLLLCHRYQPCTPRLDTLPFRNESPCGLELSTGHSHGLIFLFPVNLPVNHTVCWALFAMIDGKFLRTILREWSPE